MRDLAPLWDNLGEVGREAAGLAAGEPYATGVAGGYLVSVAHRGGRRVIVIADDADQFRRTLPTGRKPGRPSLPPR